MTKYSKSPFSFEQQADLLLSRGLLANHDLLINRLKNVNYYRLSAYWYPYRLPNSDMLLQGTTLDLVWKHYTFDRQFRLLVMDAIERFEISFRTRMVNISALKHGAFAYLDHRNLPGLTKNEHVVFIDLLRDEFRKSRELFVEHYKNKYYSESDLPVWMLCELMTFGSTLTMYRGFEKHIQTQLASEFNIPSFVLESWLKTLNYIRNLCAHHSRLWNRTLAIKPLIPKIHIQPRWHSPVQIKSSQHQMFSVLSLLNYLLRIIAPQSEWTSRLENLLEKYPEVDISKIGFPTNWKESPIWKKQPQMNKSPEKFNHR